MQNNNFSNEKKMEEFLNLYHFDRQILIETIDFYDFYLKAYYINNCFGK